MWFPPLVANLAKHVGLSAGFSIDLRAVDPDDGLPWDLTLANKRHKLEQRIKDEKPLLLIGYPPCTIFSSLFIAGIPRMNPRDVREKIREGLQHLYFCIKLYKSK